MNSFLPKSKKHLFRQVGSGDGKQRLLRPRHEPVYDGIVDEAWKVTAPGSKCVSDRRHGQHNVQVVGTL